ncbi:MAG: archaellin/type IV pilin N-terminal domain-containing protein [Candidatus Bathyarchaeia archaeon]
MKRKICANKRGISPVVATVILVAVTIVVAVAVAYWMGGITSLYTRFEKLEITSAYAEYDDNMTHVTGWSSSDGWNITITLKNTGSADATIDNVFINGKPLTEYSGSVSTSTGNASTTVNVPITVGDSQTINLYIKKGEPFTAGVSLEVRLHSAAGQEYPKTVTLP